MRYIISESVDAAVEHEPSIPLQILAGPGSGKTKVDTLLSLHLQLALMLASRSWRLGLCTSSACTNLLRVRYVLWPSPTKLQTKCVHVWPIYLARNIRPPCKWVHSIPSVSDICVCIQASSDSMTILQYATPKKGIIWQRNLNQQNSHLT